MENDKSQILQRLKDANNVLVTVSQNPSVDQLSAAIGMTLVLNKLGKHGTAVFSGSVPSTIEFLKPEETLEKTTDSLRDFIIALDKSKADKLRYKVEDQHVKIFITPYRTTITQDDLDFSHGDFNVDVVLALGVHVQQDLDQAITAHGRILHDATVVSVNTDGKGELGGINLTNPDASSLSEITAGLSNELKDKVFDSQIATAFLTGIVAETDRFSNEKTKPATMTISAKLMAAGANQQLVAAKLAEPEKAPEPENTNSDAPDYSTGEARKANDGSLAIDHEDEHPPVDKIHIDEHGNVKDHQEDEEKTEEASSDANDENKTDESSRSRRIIEPPSHGGTLTASGKQEQLEPSVDPLSAAAPKDRPILSHGTTESSAESKDASQDSVETQESTELPEPQPLQSAEPDIDWQNKPDAAEPSEGSQTLEELEKAVDSPHQQEKADESNSAGNEEPAPNLDDLQSAVSDAFAGSGEQQPMEPIAALNANPVNLDLGHDAPAAPAQPDTTQPSDDYLDVSQLDTESGTPKDAPLPPPTDSLASPAAGVIENPSAPPPVPPPMMPPSMPGPESDDDISLPPINQ